MTRDEEYGPGFRIACEMILTRIDELQSGFVDNPTWSGMEQVRLEVETLLAEETDNNDH